jgi:hypothetical protein
VMPDIFLSISTSLFPPPPILLGWYDDEGRDLSLISARVLAVSTEGLVDAMIDYLFLYLIFFLCI